MVHKVAILPGGGRSANKSILYEREKYCICAMFLLGFNLGDFEAHTKARMAAYSSYSGRTSFPTRYVCCSVVGHKQFIKLDKM